LKTSLKRKENTERDPAGVARDRCVRGERVADLLAGAAAELDSVLARAQADRIRVCAGNANHWVAEDLHNSDGECFNGNGTLYACGCRLCQSCLAKRSSRSRRELRAAVEGFKLLVGENWRFVTLTAPPMPGLSLLAARAVVDRAWQLFRRRDWWLSRIRGGGKSEEFTVVRHGYHYHIHALVVSRWVEAFMLRQEWTLCLMQAFEDAGLAWECRTRDGLAVANVQLVTKRGSAKENKKPFKERRVVSTEAAILETAKYMTKNDSWSKLPPSHLVEVAEVPRWPRQFELFGCLREARAAAAAGALVETEIAVESDYLDTTEISDGAERETSGCDPPSVGKTSRRETWRDVATTSTRENWLIWLAGVVERVQEQRRSALREKYPAASFRDLTGQEW
jgi:hypothetical protein